MFKLEDFVVKTITGMIGNEPTYKIMQYSLGWYQKDVLNDDDMALINSNIEAYEASLIPQDPVVDDTVDDNMQIPTDGVEDSTQIPSDVVDTNTQNPDETVDTDVNTPNDGVQDPELTLDNSVDASDGNVDTTTPTTDEEVK